MCAQAYIEGRWEEARGHLETTLHGRLHRMGMPQAPDGAGTGLVGLPRHSLSARCSRGEVGTLTCGCVRACAACAGPSQTLLTIMEQSGFKAPEDWPVRAPAARAALLSPPPVPSGRDCRRSADQASAVGVATLCAGIPGAHGEVRKSSGRGGASVARTGGPLLRMLLR